MIGQQLKPAWLQTDWILGQFGRQRNRARTGYINFVWAGVGLPSVWNDLKGQIFLGSEAFVSQIQSAFSSFQSLEEIPRMQRRPLAKPLTHYLTAYTDDPHVGMALSVNHAMKAIVDVFGVHYTTVSRAVKAHESPCGE